MPGEAPGESVADEADDGVAGLADADAVGVDWAGRFAGADDRFAEAAGGTMATAAWKGRAAHDPSAAELSAADPAAADPAGADPASADPASADPAGAETQVAGVCRAVTFPDAGGGTWPKPRAR
jgi:hypothetical protein